MSCIIEQVKKFFLFCQVDDLQGHLATWLGIYLSFSKESSLQYETILKSSKCNFGSQAKLFFTHTLSTFKLSPHYMAKFFWLFSLKDQIRYDFFMHEK